MKKFYPSIQRNHFWKYYSSLGLATFFILLFTSRNKMVDNWSLIVFSIATCVVMFLGIIYFKPNPQKSWKLIFLGQISITIGHIFFVFSKELFPVTKYGILSAVCYIVGNALFLIGLKVLLNKYDKFLSKSTKLSGIILSLSLWIVLWVLRIQTDLKIPNDLLISTIIVIFLIELLLSLILLSVLIMTKAGKTITLILLFSSGLFFCLGATNFLPNLGETFAVLPKESLWMFSKADVFFSIASFLIGLAYIHPSISQLPDTNELMQAENPMQMINILGVSFLMIPGSFLILYLRGNEVNFLYMLLMCSLVFLLVFLQIKQLIQDYNQLKLLNLTLNDSNNYLNKLANTDHLTQLLNRNFLYEYLPISLKKADLTQQKIAIILLDLDDFKIVNDHHGHEQGDLILKAFSEKILKFKRKGDYCVRYGGDEFLLIFEDLQDEMNVFALLNRIINNTDSKEIIDTFGVNLTVSAGISIFPDHGDNVRDLIRSADIALYRAKQNGKGNIQIFSKSHL
jgi:diguanylate cyclase (GGDEF)-like protein